MPNSSLTRRGPVRVSDVTVMFWIIKGLSTALGESTSDYLVHAMAPELAVVLGFLGFCAALALQLRAGRYVAWRYWLTVVMVGVFGTMAADVLHVGFHVPYQASALLYAASLAVIFYVWQRVEGTLDVHSIDTPRRELFYWAAVAATFAMGTALGDLTAYTMHLGFGASAALFGAGILVPAAGYRFLRWNGVFAFWFAYVLTRPLGASIADALGKPKAAGGVGFGQGPAVLVFSAAIALLVAYLTVSD